MRISDSSRNNESCWGGTVEAERTNAVAMGREVSGRSKDEGDRGGRFARAIGRGQKSDGGKEMEFPHGKEEGGE
jgi:hypothetical protein